MWDSIGFMFLVAFGIFLGVISSSIGITPDQWHKAEEHCSANEGVDKFVAKTLDDNVVLCKNGARFILKGDGK